jgi:hypothetical protein
MVTVILLLLLGAAIMFFLLVALNGYSDREAGPALVTSVVCQGAGVILSAVLAWKLTRWFIERLKWNKVLSVIVSILAGTVLGGGLGLVSSIVAVLVAESMR